jgi:L-rhamnose mutarotase
LRNTSRITVTYGLRFSTAFAIYQVEDRLVMVIETEAQFSFSHKALLDEQNAAVKRWESLMARFQKPLRNTAPAEKWRLAKSVFCLTESLEAVNG